MPTFDRRTFFVIKAANAPDIDMVFRNLSVPDKDRQYSHQIANDNIQKIIIFSKMKQNRFLLDLESGSNLFDIKDLTSCFAPSGKISQRLSAAAEGLPWSGEADPSLLRAEDG